MDKETIIEYSCILQNVFINEGMNPALATALNTLINIVIVSAVVFILDIIVRKFIVQAFKAFSVKTKTSFDDYLVQSNFPRFIAHFVPLAVVWYLAPIILLEYPFIQSIALVAINIYLVILCALVVRSVLRTTRNYLQGKERYNDKPLDSYIQVMMIFVWGICLFLIINQLTGYSVTSLATLGAASAVILLIFKDTILGFVASIQVSVNDIVRIGDWITFSKYGADGYVTEINLATVRVQNFDNTFTTIPTYSLIADSFQNWRGMQESKGRRIKRSIHIKQNSIKFLSAEELEDLKKIQLIKPYIEHRQRDVEKYNRLVEADKSLLINGRNQTNLGIFRKYADALLHENPAINKDLFLMVRHLAPTDKGIPIEIFCFSYDKNWENYEHIQADIFDHLLAAVPYFGLEVFESPSGSDLNKILLKSP
ncbi:MULTISPECIES: mechanosensitive ion channel domain-containing protein [Altibacter]|uniref:mechanosensitive ion channel family protein n=1 Tax=Altibacter TaxID=1535231 RepID=UPI0005513715|nr:MULTISPECIES: mechanosensitive ion channel domain-containing protein [Altibacter]MCW8980578.1 mechanosensitive ion channel family protein [Altibacter sp.]MCW9038434.1 mechanosensitive ion channel family protein [Altibacter sp.]